MRSYATLRSTSADNVPNNHNISALGQVFKKATVGSTSSSALPSSPQVVRTNHQNNTTNNSTSNSNSNNSNSHHRQNSSSGTSSSAVTIGGGGTSNKAHTTTSSSLNTSPSSPLMKPSVASVATDNKSMVHSSSSSSPPSSFALPSTSSSSSSSALHGNPSNHHHSSNTNTNPSRNISISTRHNSTNNNGLLMSPIATDTPIHYTFNPNPSSSLASISNGTRSSSTYPTMNTHLPSPSSSSSSSSSVLPNPNYTSHPNPTKSKDKTNTNANVNDDDDDDNSSIDISDIDDSDNDNNDPSVSNQPPGGMGRAAIARFLKQKRTTTHSNGNDNHNDRPLTPTSAIAAAFRNLQDRYDNLTIEHQKCEKRITTAQVTAAEATRNAAHMVKVLEAQLQQTQQQLYDTQHQLQDMRQQLTHAQTMVLEREKHAADGNALLMQAKTLVEATANEASEATHLANTLRQQLNQITKEAELYKGKITIAEQIAQNHAKEAQTAGTRLVTLMNEVAGARTDAVKAQAEVQEMKKKFIMYQSQTKAAEQSTSTLRKEFITVKQELQLLKTLSGCGRCRKYDLPETGDMEEGEGKSHGEGGQRSGDRNGVTTTNDNSAYYQQLHNHYGPWFSVDAVKGALTEAAAVKLVVLAPTVRITIAHPNDSYSPSKYGSNSSNGGGGDNVFRTPLPIERIQNVIETTILPRFAAVFSTPRLRGRHIPSGGGGREITKGGNSGGSGGTSSGSSLTGVTEFSNGPEDYNGTNTNTNLEQWLQRLMKRLQEDVVTAIQSSEHFRIKIMDQGVDMER